ncbi:hypothetical protein LPJ61_000058 [Coemansia biformis]|uniref:LAG1-DNAbind-domain-containing protein n=1 Tax=Coemansia biformis TaxID=1286918 RepID=A0A9W7YHS9_9FUNG|nr:hypothetical protein LPJ61_000058 [Coemansia biformis]
MFSPSFMDAMESAAAAAAAGVSPPQMFYNVTSPYTPSQSHHNSFTIPSTAPHTQGMDFFSTGPLIAPFSSEVPDHGTAGPAVSAAAPARASICGMDDFSAGLNISMNAVAAAAAVAAMGGPYDGGAHHRSSSSASAFSRAHQGSDDVSQLLYGGSGAATQPSGLGIDISTTLASFANIPGLDHFSSPSLSLHGSLGHARFSSAVGAPGLMVSSPILTAGVMDCLGPSPNAAAAHAIKSPAAAPKRSRKRAATVANIGSECAPQPCRLDQRAPSSSALISADSSDGGGSVSRTAGDGGVQAGRAFNSQAVVRGTGSKVAVVLTSKVAQKSYGTEKRFLCPPPTILLFGDSWGLPVPGGDDEVTRGSDFLAAMPRISVSVPTSDGADAGSDLGGSRASLSSDGHLSQLEWLPMPEPTPKPKAHVPHVPVPPARMPREDETVTGRFVAKQLFINDVDEKRKRVSVKVRLYDPTGQVLLNEFESRPIKVISKPSKKRQSVKNVDLCIHHGSTISLFNRLRSQTVSTKYLGASCSVSEGGPRPFWFPAGGAGSGPEGTTTFVARNSVWDPFIIWIVNTHLSKPEIEAFNARIAENRTPIAGYPTPPTFALQPQCPPDFDSPDAGDAGSMDGDAAGQAGARIPIMYNQAVILQCVSTGMCSPVLTLRKVEKGSIAAGSFYGRDPSRDVHGDPVSQLHKVAFEMRVQTRDELPAVTVTPAGLHAHAGSYLTCMGDIVGVNKSNEGRQLTSDGTGAGRSPGARGSPGRKQAKDGASAGTTSWVEDVGDNAVWTMVGTDCAIYRFDYPPASDVVSQLHQLGATASAIPTHDMALGPPSPSAAPAPPLAGSLALPPTPTSPHGLRDYLQGTPHQQPVPPQLQAQYSFDMIFAGGESGPAVAAAAVAALAPGMGSGGNAFQSGVLDASLAASVCGLGIPGIGDALAPHLVALSHQQQQQHQQQQPAQAAIGGSLAGAHPVATVDGGRTVPVVFRSTVQQPPAASPSALGGGRRRSDNSTLFLPDRPYIMLHGANFTPDMVVTFDGQQSIYTEFKSHECIACLGPLASEFAREAEGAGSDAGAVVRHRGAVPTSPSASDSSGHTPSDEAGLFGAPDVATPRTHRASSADSTASSATATHSSRGAPAGKGLCGTAKVAIHLSCGGGTGPTYKTGQFFTMHL